MQRLYMIGKGCVKGQYRCNLDCNRNKYYIVRDAQLYGISFGLELDSRVGRQTVNPGVDCKVFFNGQDTCYCINDPLQS